MDTKHSGLLGGFLRSVAQHPARPALHLHNLSYSYEDMAARASRLAAAVRYWEPVPGRTAAVFAHRSMTAYAGVLGTLMAGKGYVPLHPRFPLARTQQMLSSSGARVIIAGNEALPALVQMLPTIVEPMLVVCPETEDVSSLRACSTRHNVVGSDQISGLVGDFDPVPVESDQCAYLLFTSGSTGSPKGVPVSHGNVTAYLDHVSQLYCFTPEDRVSQAFDLTFDLSVHDLFLTWSHGACLYSLPDREVMAPARFIHDQKLTVWFSVPSVIMFLTQMRLLKPGAFETLRLSLFCGEPLAESLAARWQEAAPRSIIENLYGPTEATIAISRYRWTKQSSAQGRNGIVPIGQIFPSQKAAILDDNLHPVPDGGPGELCLAGSQVTGGYLNAPERTASAFIHRPGQNGILWYRTGDLVTRGSDGCLFYLGRTDHQVKIRGHRVELQEIECVVRRAAEREVAVAVPHPVRDGCAEGIYVFLCGDVNDEVRRSIIAECKRSLPEYMVPRSIHVTSELPLNANGKVDRKALAASLERN